MGKVAERIRGELHDTDVKRADCLTVGENMTILVMKNLVTGILF